MNRIATALTGGLLMAAAVTPALAGGYAAPVAEPAVTVAPAPTVVAGRDWTGGFAGAQLGWGKVNGSGTVDGDGALGGVHAGYNYDFGRWVLGGKLSYDTGNLDIGAGDRFRNMTKLEARVGADMGRWMPYVAVGAAHADARLAGVSRSDTGYFGGLGVDYALNDRWTVGGEVLAHRFKDFDKTGVNINPNTVQVGASFNF